MAQRTKIDDRRPDDPFLRRVIDLGLDPDEIIELDLTDPAQAVPGERPRRRRQRDGLDPSSVGYRTKR